MWTLVLVPTVIQMVDGWRPVRDDAMISIGAYRVFSLGTPLVGVWSQASQGLSHSFFDLGPLLFWLLAVPVRLDPGQGAILGAAVVCGATLSLAVEAGWSVAGPTAGVGVVAVAADLGGQTQAFADLVWNPHFGVVMLLAATATAWAVSSGRFGWWPLLVGCASVAAQCHLLYLVPSVALVVAAPPTAVLLGCRVARWRWAWVGMGVGAVCWALPLGQEVFGRARNLSLVIASRSVHPRIGPGFGLHALSTALAPRPVWLTAYPFSLVPAIDSHPIAWCAVPLVVLVVVVVWARATGRRALAALAVITVVTALSLAISFASLDASDLVVVSYLANVLWPLGTLAWIVVAWAAAAGLMAARHRTRHRTGGRSTASAGPRRRTGIVVAAGGVAVLAIVLGLATTSLVTAARSRAWAVAEDRPLDGSIARAVERHVPHGPISVAFRLVPRRTVPGFYGIDEWGAAYDLLTAGHRPGLITGFYGSATDLVVPVGSAWPAVTVSVDPVSRSVVGVAVSRRGATQSR